MFKSRTAQLDETTQATPVQPAPRLPTGTFAERKAAREAAGRPASGRPVNIVSLGFDKKLFRNQRNRDVWLDVELGVDWSRRNHRYYRIVGDTVWEATFNTSTRPSETPEPLGTIDPKARFATSTYQPAEPDTVRPVE